MERLANRQKATLANHGLYTRVNTIEDLRYFTERHVACVLDFMSLLKSLQQELTCTTIPWVPPTDPEAAALINEIVLGEESDEARPGVHLSHFDWYIEAMGEIGADTGPILKLVEDLRAGVDSTTALENSGLPAEAVEFSKKTFEFCNRPLHSRLAVFLHGREDVIPRMFLPLAYSLQNQGLECPSLVGYLMRHVEVDAGEHGPAAQKLLERLVGDDPIKMREGLDSTVEALDARDKLWTAVYESLESRVPV